MTRAQADAAIRDAAPSATTDATSSAASGAAPSSAALDATPADGHVMSDEQSHRGLGKDMRGHI